MLKQACIALAISALVLGFGGRPSQAGWSDADSSLTKGTFSPVILVKKNKNHDDDDDDDNHHGKGKKKNTDGDTSDLSECTIQGPNSGGGCKGGFKYVCEKMKSGKKCCGCVADKNAKSQQAPAQAGQKGEDNVLWGDYQKAPPQTEQGTENKGGTLLLPYCEEKNGQLVCTESKGQ